MQPAKIATWSDVLDREPVGALVGNADLVIVRYDDSHSVLYGRCLHRGAKMADGHVVGNNLICSLHAWTMSSKPASAPMTTRSGSTDSHHGSTTTHCS